jgi:hypothetical protein
MHRQTLVDMKVREGQVSSFQTLHMTLRKDGHNGGGGEGGKKGRGRGRGVLVNGARSYSP